MAHHIRVVLPAALLSQIAKGSARPISTWHINGQTFVVTVESLRYYEKYRGESEDFKRFLEELDGNS